MPISKEKVHQYIRDIFENNHHKPERNLQIAVKRRIRLIMELLSDFHLQSLGNFKILNPKNDGNLPLSDVSVIKTISDPIALNFRCLFFTHEEYSKICAATDCDLEGIAFSPDSKEYWFISLHPYYSNETISVDIVVKQNGTQKPLQELLQIYNRLGSIIGKWQTATRRKLKTIERANKLIFIEDQELSDEEEIKQENARKHLEEQ